MAIVNVNKLYEAVRELRDRGVAYTDIDELSVCINNCKSDKLELVLMLSTEMAVQIKNCSVYNYITDSRLSNIVKSAETALSDRLNIETAKLKDRVLQSTGITAYHLGEMVRDIYKNNKNRNKLEELIKNKLLTEKNQEDSEYLLRSIQEIKNILRNNGGKKECT